MIPQGPGQAGGKAFPSSSFQSPKKMLSDPLQRAWTFLVFPSPLEAVCRHLPEAGWEHLHMTVSSSYQR